MTKWFCVFAFFLLACNTKEKSNVDSLRYSKMSQQELEVEFNTLNEEIRKNINNGDLYIKRSILYRTLGDLQAAMEDADRALKIDPNKPAYLEEKGILMIRNRDFKQAENAFVKCAQIDRENETCRLKLAELYFYSRRFQDAMEWTNNVLKINKYNADAYFLKGMIHLSAGDSTLAESSFQTAVEQNPDFFEAYFQLGSLLAAKGNPLAIDYYNNAIRIKPEMVEPYYNKGLLSQELGMYNEALQTYSELLKIDPTYKEAHFNMGYVNMFYLKEYNQGSVHFNNAIKVAPDYYQAYYNRGYCYELLGDVNRALIDYENALKIKPDYTLAAEGKERVLP